MVPFLPHYLKQKGFSPLDVTSILGIVPFVVIFTKPLIGHIADRLQQYRPVLFTTLGLGIVCMSLVLVVPGVHDETNISPMAASSLQPNLAQMCEDQTLLTKTLKQTTNETIILLNENCSYHYPCQPTIEEYDDLTSPCSETEETHVLCNRDGLKELCTRISQGIEVGRLICRQKQSANYNITVMPSGKQYRTHLSSSSFWLLFLLVISANAFGLSPSYTLVDVLTLTALKGKTEDYGKQRMWMSAGLATSIILVAAVMDQISEPNSSLVNYSPAFVGFVFFLALSAICAIFVPVPSPDTNLIRSAPLEKAGLIKLLPVVTNCRVLMFCSMAVICGMNFGKAAWLNIWYLKELGAPQLTIGVIVIFYCLSTMVTFYFSGRLIAYFGHEVTLLLVLAVYSIRALFWSFITEAWQALPIELTLGFCTGLWLANMGSYANRVSPQGTQATGQALLSGIYDGLGDQIGFLNLFSIMRENFRMSYLL